MAINNGDLIKARSSPEVWFIEFNTRRWIPDPPTLTATWSWSNVKVLSDLEVFQVPRGPNLTSVLKETPGNYGWAIIRGRNHIPGPFGTEHQRAGIALTDINGNGRPDVVIFHVNNPTGENVGTYRVGWDVDAAGIVQGGWTTDKPVPGWFGAENQGAGIAISDINGSGRPDLVVFHLDNPGGENAGYYRVGWDLDATGDVQGGWSGVKPIPGWFGSENQGGDVALIDIDGNGRPELIVAHMDNPGGGNQAYYRIGWNLDHNGDPQRGWSPLKPIPGWFGSENQGLGLAAFFHFGDRALAVAHVDNPAASNRAYVRVTALDRRGNTIAGWSQPIWLQAPTGMGTETAGVGNATGYVTGRTHPDLITYYVDNPAGPNAGYYFLSEALVNVP